MSESRGVREEGRGGRERKVVRQEEGGDEILKRAVLVLAALFMRSLEG